MISGKEQVTGLNLTADENMSEENGKFGRHWGLDPAVVFLNHGSFGACPRLVLRQQATLRRRMEREPLLFLHRQYEHWLDAARAEVAAFVGCAPADFVFVPNATAGVNAVLRSLRFAAGDELLVTDHEYNACRNALDYAAAQAGARVVLAPVPFPVASPEMVLDSVLSRVTPQTRLALIDHITSQTALVMPVERLSAELHARGVDVLVDGAHAPGMVPLQVKELGVAYYTGNFHKWVCAPKGAAFLYVRSDKQAQIRPVSISHGANSLRTDRARYQLEFDWTGTHDPTAWLAVPAAIRLMGTLLPGGWPVLMERNHRLAVAARRIVLAALGIPAPCPEEMLGAMAAMPLPDGRVAALRPPLYLDPLQEDLFDQHHIEIPVIHWPAPPKRLIRLSAQAYNYLDQYRHLATALGNLLS